MAVSIRHGFRRLPRRIADNFRPFLTLFEQPVKESGCWIRAVTFIGHDQQQLILTGSQTFERNRNRLLPVRSFARANAIHIEFETVVRSDDGLRDSRCGG